MTDPPVALVTGGAVRVGAAIAAALDKAGYRVWVHAHRSEPEQPLPRGLGVVRADLTDPAQRETLCRRVLASDGPAGGRLDLLVNNAASFERGRFAERSDVDLQRVLALNLVAPLALVRGCLPGLQPRGAVVNILDVAAYHPWPEYLDHCVSKAALKAATEALAVELAPIRVNAVAPGTVAWPADEAQTTAARRQIEAQIPLGQIGRPQDVGQAVAFLAQAPHITGQVLAVDGGRLAAIAGARP